MKILFIYIDCNSAIFAPHYSHGIGMLSAILKQHAHDPKLVYYRGPQKISALMQTIEDWQPDVVGFSSMSSGFPNVQDASALIKRRYPQIFVICGGIHPTLVPSCLEETPTLDAICRGEGEYPLLALLDALQHERDHTTTSNFWFRSKGQIIQNPLRPVVENIDVLPVPDREVFDYETIIQNFHGRGGEFLFCRGCPFDCSYCSNAALKQVYPGKYVRYPSVSKAMTEMLQVKERYHLDTVIFHDDIITLNKPWFFEFFEAYRDQIHLPFACQIRVGTCDREMMKVLKAAGCCRLIIGMESGNEYLRTHVLRRNMTNAQILETFQWAHAEGLPTHTQNMVGLPEETPKRFVDTIRLTAAAKVDSPSVNIFHPYPGTALYQYCLERGLIENTTPPADFKERSDSILRLPDFRRNDIVYYNEHFARFVQRERKVLEQPFCLERLLPPYPVFFRVIAWHEALKKYWTISLVPSFIQALRRIRIHGLGWLQQSIGPQRYGELKRTFHKTRTFLNARKTDE